MATPAFAALSVLSVLSMLSMLAVGPWLGPHAPRVHNRWTSHSTWEARRARIRAFERPR